MDCCRQHRFLCRGWCKTIDSEPLTAATRSSLAALNSGRRRIVERIVALHWLQVRRRVHCCASSSQSNFCQWHTFQKSPVVYCRILRRKSTIDCQPMPATSTAASQVSANAEYTATFAARYMASSQCPPHSIMIATTPGVTGATAGLPSSESGSDGLKSEQVNFRNSIANPLGKSARFEPKPSHSLLDKPAPPHAHVVLSTVTFQKRSFDRTSVNVFICYVTLWQYQRDGLHVTHL